MKICGICKEELEDGKFYRDNSRSDGLFYSCKECSSRQRKQMHKTKNGVTLKIYDGQKVHSKERKHNPPDYTLNEMREWVYSQQIFHRLYDDWVKSGHKKDSKPSIDRLDDSLGYSFRNIRLCTWKENRDKAYRDMSGSGFISRAKPVIQMSLDGDIVNEFHSAQEAYIRTGARANHITEVCNNKRKTCHKFKWKYKKENK